MSNITVLHFNILEYTSVGLQVRSPSSLLDKTASTDERNPHTVVEELQRWTSNS
jgi:hypothetical protein